MVWMMGHYPDCNSGPPCLVVDDYKKKHNFRQVGGFAAYVLFKKLYQMFQTFQLQTNVCECINKACTRSKYTCLLTVHVFTESTWLCYQVHLNKHRRVFHYPTTWVDEPIRIKHYVRIQVGISYQRCLYSIPRKCHAIPTWCLFTLSLFTIIDVCYCDVRYCWRSHSSWTNFRVHTYI